MALARVVHMLFACDTSSSKKFPRHSIDFTSVRCFSRDEDLAASSNKYSPISITIIDDLIKEMSLHHGNSHPNTPSLTCAMLLLMLLLACCEARFYGVRDSTSGLVILWASNYFPLLLKS